MADRINIELTEMIISENPLSPDTDQEYLGGRGLATRLFVDNIDPVCDPLDPGNVIFISTSPARPAQWLAT